MLPGELCFRLEMEDGVDEVWELLVQGLRNAGLHCEEQRAVEAVSGAEPSKKVIIVLCDIWSHHHQHPGGARGEEGWHDP